MSVKNYIKELLSFEEYSFSWSELKNYSDKSDIALRRELFRLTTKNEIINLRRDFYLIIPPRYSALGRLPLDLYADKLFKFLKKDYYIGLFSAAKYHGAAHQQVQKDYILSSPPALLDISKKNIKLEFHTVSVWPEKNVLDKRSDAGIFKISSPALTAADLINNQLKIGGINRIFTVIEELSEEIILSDLKELLSWYPNVSNLQRLGFILEQVKSDQEILKIVYDHISSKGFYPVLLSPEKGKKAGAVNNRWKVDVNIKPESDL